MSFGYNINNPINTYLNIFKHTYQLVFITNDDKVLSFNIDYDKTNAEDILIKIKNKWNLDRINDYVNDPKLKWC